jgi:hypothetical protein
MRRIGLPAIIAVEMLALDTEKLNMLWPQYHAKLQSWTVPA